VCKKEEEIKTMLMMRLVGVGEKEATLASPTFVSWRLTSSAASMKETLIIGSSAFSYYYHRMVGCII
jgi:hypothetical protein